jgi:hypothetical protein
LNTAELDPAAIVTHAGAVSWLFEVETATLTPPVGALLLRVTVQLLAADGESTGGLQASEDMTTGATMAIVALAELPL